MAMIAFILGMFVGAFVGAFVICLCIVCDEDRWGKKK